MDRRTVIPCYSTHHTQAWRYRGLWADGQSYLAIAHTTLRPGDIEGTLASLHKTGTLGPQKLKELVLGSVRAAYGEVLLTSKPLKGN